MARILVVEDDSTVRDLAVLYLQAGGHDVSAAADGAAGLAQAREELPDLIVSDVRMPQLDGFAMLTALRAADRTAHIPLIFLSALEDRQSLRLGMDLGADDFLAKPVRRDELLRSVEARLRRTRRLREVDAHSVALATVTPAPVGAPLAPAGAPSGRRVCKGTLVVITLRNALSMAQGLSATARRATLQSFFSRLREPILAQRGWVVHHRSTELVAVFESPKFASEWPGDDAVRALNAALLAISSVQKFRVELAAQASAPSRIACSIGVALHSGEFEVRDARGGQDWDGNAEGRAVIGRVVDLASRIEPMIGPLGWSIAVSADTLRAAGSVFTLGRRATLVTTTRTGADPFDLIEITGLAPSAGMASAACAIAPMQTAIAAAIKANSALAAQAYGPDGQPSNAFDAACDRAMQFADGIPGYSVERRLGAGGMSRVYLARESAAGEAQVLKVMTIDEDDPDTLQRFIQEYALIAQIRHPNVARIHGQGFVGNNAYIAMEYLVGGDLRTRILAADGGMCVAHGMRYLAQLALALTALHAKGIVHRDLKPENVMFRNDGTLVLADFGIAKQLTTNLTKTRHGEVFGTPFYMSPEQARGQAVDHRSDLYSLGVILHEMLTGAKPFTATNAEALAYQHVHSDIPLLPGRFWRLQPVLDRLLAKRPDDRYASAIGLLAAVHAIGDAPLEQARAAYA